MDGKPKRVYWITYYDKLEDGPLQKKLMCSECRADGLKVFKYCPMCGSEMEEENGKHDS